MHYPIITKKHERTWHCVNGDVVLEHPVDFFFIFYAHLLRRKTYVSRSNSGHQKLTFSPGTREMEWRFLAVLAVGFGFASPFRGTKRNVIGIHLHSWEWNWNEMGGRIWKTCNTISCLHLSWWNNELLKLTVIRALIPAAMMGNISF